MGGTVGTPVPEGTPRPPWPVLPLRTVPSRRPRPLTETTPPQRCPALSPQGGHAPSAVPPHLLSRPLARPRPSPAGSRRGAGPLSVALRAGEGSGAASPSRLWQRRARRGRGCSSESNGAVRAGQRAEGKRQGARHRALRQGTAEGRQRRRGEGSWGGGVSSRLSAERARAATVGRSPPALLPPSAFPPGGLRVPSRLPRPLRAHPAPRRPRSSTGHGEGSPSEQPPEHPAGAGGSARGGSRRGAGTKAEPRACARRRERVREPR